VTAEEAQQS
jgi:hypothetical protein